MILNESEEMHLKDLKATGGHFSLSEKIPKICRLNCHNVMIARSAKAQAEVSISPK